MLIYRERKDEYVTRSEVIKNNLHTDGTKFNIHVHRNVIYRVRKDEHFTHSEEVQNNLHPDGTKLNIHVYKIDIQNKKR